MAKKIEETEKQFINRKLRENLKNQETSLRTERDHIPFERVAISAVKQLVESLQAGNMEMRCYEEKFLHAKAYIFSPAIEGEYGKQEAVIAGSSNLTASGLSSNLEINLGRYDTPTVAKSKNWFDRLWAEAESVKVVPVFLPQMPSTGPNRSCFALLYLTIRG